MEQLWFEDAVKCKKTKTSMFEKSKSSLVGAATSRRGVGTYRTAWDSSRDDGEQEQQAGTSSQRHGETIKNFRLTSGGASNTVKSLAITVIFLDDSQHTFEVEVRETNKK